MKNTTLVFTIQNGVQGTGFKGSLGPVALHVELGHETVCKEPERHMQDPL